MKMIRKMEITKKWLLMPMIVVSLLSGSVYADQPQMKTTLVKAVNQLHAVKLLLLQAKTQQETNSRIRVRFSSWKDSQGAIHKGLLDDVAEIQQALIEIVNNKNTDPRIYQPIHGDYVGEK